MLKQVQHDGEGGHAVVIQIVILNSFQGDEGGVPHGLLPKQHNAVACLPKIQHEVTSKFDRKLTVGSRQHRGRTMCQLDS